MRELIHQQHEQFHQSKESTALVNEKYHDLKSLLESFQGQISQTQIDQLKEKVGGYDTLVDTGNRVLDVVLAEKRATCGRRGMLWRRTASPSTPPCGPSIPRARTTAAPWLAAA